MVAGGFKAIRSVASYTRQIGLFNLYKTITSKNACKACALGTGGQNGGVYNEQKKGLEICNKNIQAHTSDARGPISNTLYFEKSIQELAHLSGRQLEGLGRIATPLIKRKGDKHYTPINYESALSIVAERLNSTTPDKSFFYASGRSSNEAAYSLQLLARLYGTNNVNNCSYYCHQASGAALGATIGTSTATIEYADLDKSDCIFLFGANPASNHPRFLKALIRLRRRGGHVIVVNPAKESGLVKFAAPSDLVSMIKGGESISSQYIQPHLGGDIAFMQGIIKWLDQENCIATEFIAQHTSGFESFIEKIRQLEWSQIESDAGLSLATIKKAASTYSKSKNTIFCWSMGLTHHLHGVANIQTLVTLALARAMIGRPGAGLLPLRGHSNIQGTGSMGFTPQLKTTIEEKIQERLDLELPKQQGLDTMACMQAADENKMEFALMLGGNLYGSNPDSNFAAQALNKIPFKCFINSTHNHSHFIGVDQECIIFPIRVRDEEEQATTQESMFNFVRLSDGGFNRLPQLISETQLICRLGKKVINKKKFDFSELEDHNNTRKLISQTIPGFHAIESIFANKDEFHIEGRLLHTQRFPTETGKAQFIFHASPSRESNQFYLSTVRSEGQFNSIIFHEEDSYRNQKSRSVLMMNPKDMRELNLSENDKVDISSTTGTLKNLSVKPFDIREKNVMTYYPEANVVIPKAVDPISQTPAFKSTPITITPSVAV